MDRARPLPYPHAHNDCEICRERDADFHVLGEAFNEPGKRPLLLCQQMPGAVGGDPGLPVEGRDGKVALPVTGPARTQTARAETGLAVPPFTAALGSSGDTTAIIEPLRNVTTDGDH